MTATPVGIRRRVKGMARVTGGEFLMGSADFYPEEGPVRRVAAHVEAGAGDGERAELGPDLALADLAVAVIERHGPGRAVRPLLFLLE